MRAHSCSCILSKNLKINGGINRTSWCFRHFMISASSWHILTKPAAATFCAWNQFVNKRDKKENKNTRSETGTGVPTCEENASETHAAQLLSFLSTCFLFTFHCFGIFTFIIIYFVCFFVLMSSNPVFSSKKIGSFP